MLELIALGSPLAWVLEALSHGVTSLTVGMRAGIFALRHDGELHAPVCLYPDPPADLPGPDGFPTARAALDGRPCLLADAPAELPTADARARAAAAGVRAAWSQPVFNPDGRVIGTFNLSGPEPQRPSDDDARLMLIGARLAGIALEREAKRLELEGQRDELARANAQLRAANQHKDEFLSVVSHELRNPLNVVMGYLNMLEHGLAAPGSPEGALLLAAIRQGADRMHHLVDELIDAQRARTGGIVVFKRPVPLDRIIAAAATAVGPAAAAKAQTIEVGVPPGATCLADEPRIGQVITNLLDNAVAFTPEGGLIGLTGASVGDWIEVVVTDRGPGIPDAERARIFDQFQHVDWSLTRQAGGLGLGLSICKAIVEAHGGTIGVTSRSGGGSAFTFRLPRGTEPTTHPSGS